MYRLSGGTTGSGGGSSTSMLRGVGANRCLDDPANNTTNGIQVQIWDCNGGANQQWLVNGDGTITGVHSGLCLDVTGARTANGTPVELWTCNGGSNQKWTRS